MSAALDLRLSKLLEANASLGEELRTAPPGSVDIVLLVKARWSCDELARRLHHTKLRWVKARWSQTKAAAQ